SIARATRPDGWAAPPRPRPRYRPRGPRPPAATAGRRGGECRRRGQGRSWDHSLAEGAADHIVARAFLQLSHTMPIRVRKLIGAILLIVLVATWALLAMALAQSPLVKANGVIEVIYYVVAGLGWVLPAMALIRWMSRPDPA